MSKYSKDTTLSARLNEGEVARVDRLRDVGYGRARFLSSRTRPSRSDVIRKALEDAEEALVARDTKQATDLRKLRG
jgi:hypothetical protein